MDFRFKPPLALLTAFLLVTTAFASSASADVVYEGFDYTEGDALASLNGGIGFGGAWTGGNFDVIPGLSSGDLDVVGGAVQRPSRSGNAATSRVISAASQTALTADNSTIWFSAVLQGTGAPASSAGTTAGFPTNTFGTLIFGDGALTGGSGTSAAPISTGSSAIGVSFVGNGAGFPSLAIQGVTYDGGTLATTPAADLLTVGGDAPVFVVGRVDFAANGSDDTLSLFHVTDGTAPLPTAFTTLTADLDQSTFDVVSIGDAQTSIFDEIRFGTTLEGVTPGFFTTAVPEPSSLMILGFSGVALLVRRRR